MREGEGGPQKNRSFKGKAESNKEDQKLEKASNQCFLD